MAVNRIEATAGISQVMDDFYAQIRGYEKVAWCMGPVPYELMFCAGVGCFLAENTATRIAAAHEQDKYMDTSKAAGLGVECCSYAKINIGQALLMEEGVEIAERFRLPKPDFIALGDACPSMMQWARCLGEIFDVPVFVFDMPFVEGDTKEEITEVLEYYKKRLAEFITFLEPRQHSPSRILPFGNCMCRRLQKPVILSIIILIQQKCRNIAFPKQADNLTRILGNLFIEFHHANSGRK
ncbi:MAG: 2-hydroxyacyl-CoA dehydratase family protein [Bacillota bacterium]|nr:2-hydroxyacyl-CoA dehydratase family protein [Bacillota bacterium]